MKLARGPLFVALLLLHFNRLALAQTTVVDVIGKWYVGGSDTLLVASPNELPTNSIFKGLLAYGERYPSGSQTNLNRLYRAYDSRHLHSTLTAEADYNIFQGRLTYLRAATDPAFPGLFTSMLRWHATNPDHPVGMAPGPPAECSGVSCGLDGPLGYAIPRFGTVREDLVTLSNNMSDLVILRANRVAGGAIYELSWNGKQFINDWDLAGRSLQLDVHFGDTETNNPTEAGDMYGRPAHNFECGPKPADPWPHGSPLLSLTVSGTTLETLTRPLMWRPEPYYGGDLIPLNCDDVVQFAHPVLWNGTFGKKIEMNFGGMPRVMKWTTKIDFPREYPATPPPGDGPQLDDNASIEVIVAHLVADFTKYYVYDAVEPSLKTIPTPTYATCSWAWQNVDQRPDSGGAIVATADGSYAFGIFHKGIFQPDPYESWKWEGFDVCNFVQEGMGNGKYDFYASKVDLNLRPAHVGPPFGQYQSVAYVVVGSLSQVVANMQTLHQIVP